MLLSVLSQRSYPGVGDIDDCWAVATIWARRASYARTSLPTMTEFRAAAGVPDKPGPTGAGSDEAVKGSLKLWPTCGVAYYRSTDWDAFMAELKAGRIASVSLDSAVLPANVRFGFYGSHQVGVVYLGGKLLVANPLAPGGSDPIVISETALRYAVRAVAQGWILAAMFPPPAPVVVASPGGHNVAIKYATLGPSTARMHLAQGQVLYDRPGGKRATTMAAARDVPHVGLAGSVNGHGWRAVAVGTRWGYRDGAMHRTVLYVPSSAGKVVPA